ncbi:MAG: hypothetical protein R2706_14690 [Acidimicrobiales bacterium]
MPLGVTPERFDLDDIGPHIGQQYASAGRRHQLVASTTRIPASGEVMREGA